MTVTPSRPRWRPANLHRRRHGYRCRARASLIPRPRKPKPVVSHKGITLGDLRDHDCHDRGNQHFHNRLRIVPSPLQLVQHPSSDASLRFSCPPPALISRPCPPDSRAYPAAGKDACSVPDNHPHHEPDVAPPQCSGGRRNRYW